MKTNFKKFVVITNTHSKYQLCNMSQRNLCTYIYLHIITTEQQNFKNVSIPNKKSTDVNFIYMYTTLK